MANVQSVNTVLGLSPGTANAGLTGGPTLVRSTAASAPLKSMVDSYVTLGTEATGTTIEYWPQVPATARIYDITLSFGALGAGALLSIGKIDPNNSANTDAAHYQAAVDASVAGEIRLSLNRGEQVGQDPLGDDSTGNTPPAYGAAPIILTATLTGATAPASIAINMTAAWISGF